MVKSQFKFQILQSMITTARYSNPRRLPTG